MSVDPTRSERPAAGPDAPSARDTAFLERIRRAYAPPPPSDARRLAFDRALDARLRRRRAPIWAASSLAGAAVAIAVAFVFAAGERVPPAGTDLRSPEEARAAAEWESDLLDPESFWASDEIDEFRDLPAEYAAIEGLLLDG